MLFTFLGIPNTLFMWLFLESAIHPAKQTRTTLDCFKQLCGPAELLCYPGRLASSSSTPFIIYIQWPPSSRLQLEGQVGCRVVHNVRGISNQRGAEARALLPSLPFTQSRGGELQQWPRSSSPARQEVTGKEPWEPAACSVLIAG